MQLNISGQAIQPTPANMRKVYSNKSNANNVVTVQYHENSPEATKFRKKSMGKLLGFIGGIYSMLILPAVSMALAQARKVPEKTVNQVGLAGLALGGGIAVSSFFGLKRHLKEAKEQNFNKTFLIENADIHASDSIGQPEKTECPIPPVSHCRPETPRQPVCQVAHAHPTGKPEDPIHPEETPELEEFDDNTKPMMMPVMMVPQPIQFVRVG